MNSATYICQNCHTTKPLGLTPHKHPDQRSIRTGCTECDRITQHTWFNHYRINTITQS